MSLLPFVIAFILGGKLKETVRQAFFATGGDTCFLVINPTALAFILLAVTVVINSARPKRGKAV